MTPELILAFIFGCVFVTALLLIAVFIPEPTTQQMFVFRVVLALAGAGIGAVVPGFFEIQGKALEIYIRAGGALALLVLIYLFNPPGLVAKPIQTKSTPPVIRPKPPIIREVPPHLIEEGPSKDERSSS